jgi:hypothetical protein
MSTQTEHAPPPPDDWVPVERRWLGLDRSTILPTLIVLGFALLMGSVIPAVNRAIPYDDRIETGDVMAAGRGVTFVPATDWGVTSGVRVGDVPASGATPPTTTLENGDTTFSVTVAPYDGTAEELLAQIKKTSQALEDVIGLTVNSDPISIQTSQGLDGVIAEYSGTASDGVVAAFVDDGTGIEVVAIGANDPPEDVVRDVAEMIESIDTESEVS